MSAASPATGDAGLRDSIARCRARVESALHRCLPPPSQEPRRLHEAMRYACLGGGKRVRAVMVYAAGVTTGARDADLDAAACAVELVHAYSLVHDDMPAMDDDDLRRGKPTCHKAYDEATALLVGDALQTLAFQVLATGDGELTAASRVAMLATLAEASGSRGMAGGQAIDLQAVGSTPNLAALETMHRMKTGALIRASVRLGALAGPQVDEQALADLDRYAERMGLAFQIRDDILDVEAPTAILGKQQGADAALGKPTYTSILGMEAAKARAADLHRDALAALARFGQRAHLLRAIADFIVARES